MKKIYMILAAMTLLSMSLNAQRLPADKLGGFNFTPTGKAYQQTTNGQFRMPTLASDEYLFGPYLTDDFDATGVGFAGYYTQAQDITSVVMMTQAEYESHLGDTIIGFRFALAGSSNVRVYDFGLYPTSASWFATNQYKIWELGAIGHGGSSSGSGSGSGTVTTSTDVTFSPAYSSSTVSTRTVDGVTLYTSSGDLGYTSYMYLNGTTTISTSTGTITKIVFNGYNGSTTVSNLSTTTGSYTTSSSVGTWTGSASSVSFTSSTRAQVSNVVVTVTTSSGSTSTGTIDVGNGATTDGYLPAYGFMQDTGYKNQMIYTANQLGLSSGSQITSITFYPENGTGIPFYGSTVTLSVGNTTTSYFSGSKITPSDLTAVASKRITATDVNATAWTFTFDTPFTYNGGNLLVQVYCPGYSNDNTSGQWARGYFYGDNQSNNVSIYSSGSSASGTSGTNSTFLPKATFGYTGSTAIPEYLELAGGQWHDFYLDEPVVFEFSGDTIQYVMMGYTYYQEYDTDFKPVAVNSNSTGHSHYDFMYARSSSSSSYTRGWWGDGASGSSSADRPGDMAVQLIFKSAKQKTPAPAITYTQDGSYYYVTATATDPNATVTLTVDGQTATDTGSVTILVGRGNTDRTVTATATAQEQDKLVSDPTTETINVQASPLTPTPDPTISSQVLDLSVQVTGSGEGEVHMYITVDGVTQEVTSPYYAERGTEDYYITVTVTAQINDTQHSMATTTQQVLVPKLENLDLTGWTELPGTYTNDAVINWNQYLMFVDRFSESTAANNHPAKYIYKMTEDTIKLIGDPRTTNEHIIPVQLTRSKVWGYYTEQDVLNDTLRQVVDTLLMNAEVEMSLENSSDIYYYTLDRSRNSIVDADFLDLSQLQHDGTRYVEFSEYYLPANQTFNYGAMTRFDSIDVVLPASAPQGLNGEHFGDYDLGDYMAYVPIIWTFGNMDVNKRLNWDNDHKHNSYGSPIWKTAVGKVELVGKPQLERQAGAYGSTNWTEGNIPCSMYMITDLTARGYLPRPDITNIDYEPYMFRVWVVSNKANLRNYEWVPGENGRPGSHYEGRGVIPANTPYLVWEEFIADSTQYISYDATRPDMTLFHKWKIQETDTLNNWIVPQSMNMMFAGQDDIAAGDLKILVRFYYKSNGKARNQNNNMLMSGGMRAAGGANAFYGVDVPGGGDPDPEIPTCIKNIYDVQSHGDVVSVTYVNTQGMQSTKPFSGINIVVTRYSDGTTTTTKVLR